MKKISKKELEEVITHCVKGGMPAFLKRIHANEEVIAEIERNKGAVFTFGKGYFYRSGLTEEALSKSVQEQLEQNGYTFKYLAGGDHWAPFHGGAGPMTARDSFMFVTAIVGRK